MKQIVQNFKTGETLLEEVPVPSLKAGHVLIKTTKSMVSLGTERMLVDFGNANLLQKARQQPEKVKMVLEKIKSDGLLATYENVMNKLDFPIPLGYSNVGFVEDIGDGVGEFRRGDRVVSNGPHSEYVLVAENLCAKIPDGVSDEDASFTVIASIGLQGLRLLQPTFGETIVVYGLGLIGLLSAQLLQANGCRVIGIDIDKEKLEIASSFNVDVIHSTEQEVIPSIMSKTNSIGADGVLITASANTNEIIEKSAKMSRKRGRIVLVGVTGLNLNRNDFYEKELSFQVSCSYGPGRYDPNYEEHGIDYPLPFVRWTEKRNFEAILQAMKKGQLKVSPLITDRILFDNYNIIYSEISKSRAIAQILDYRSDEKITRTVETSNISSEKGQKGKKVAIVGAGNFTQMTVLPLLDKYARNQTKIIVSSKGLNAKSLAKKYSIQRAGTDFQEALADKDIGAFLLTTRHNEHAGQVIQCLEAGKHVFVEKPLAISKDELKQIESAYDKAKINNSNITLNVGFNRRFSPFIKEMKDRLGENPDPISIIATMNAGYIPIDVWVHDPLVGGGRIIGEACHFIDLALFLTGSQIESVNMLALGISPSQITDTGSIHLKFENGSIGIINYFSNGNKSYQKERVEVFENGRTMIMDNFSRLELFGYSGKKIYKGKQDKGHKIQFRQWYEEMKSDKTESLIPFNQIMNVSWASILAVESILKNEWVTIPKTREN